MIQLEQTKLTTINNRLFLLFCPRSSQSPLASATISSFDSVSNFIFDSKSLGYWITT